jgi:hypothetical protein
MLAPLLLGMTLALPATGQTFHVYADAGADASYFTLGPDNGPGDGTAAQGEAFAGITLFPFGVVDDDAPPDLQPFLQRAFQIHVGGYGGAGAATYALSDTREDRSFGGANAYIEGYPHRNLFLSARLDVGSLHIQDSQLGMVVNSGSTLSVTPQVDIGVRLHDVLLFAGWHVTAARPDGGSFDVAFYGGAFGGLTAVFNRNARLGVRIDGVDGGATGEVSFTGYFERRFFGSLSVFYTRGKIAGSTGPSNVAYDSAGGSIGGGAWLATRFGLSFSYAPKWYDGNGRVEVQHLFTLTGFGR